MDCERYAKHERYVQAKLSASHPMNIEDTTIEDEEFNEKTERSEFIEYILTCIPPEHHDLFIVFEKSNFNLKALKPRERIVLCELIVEILQDYQEELYDV
jgi:hypothetical protein